MATVNTIISKILNDLVIVRRFCHGKRKIVVTPFDQGIVRKYLNEFLKKTNVD